MINNRSLLIVGGLAAVAWLASNTLYVVDEPSVLLAALW